MSDNIITLASYRQMHPRWGAMVSMQGIPLSDRARAELISFWGEDEHAGPETRLRAWADALEALAEEFRQTAYQVEQSQ